MVGFMESVENIKNKEFNGYLTIYAALSLTVVLSLCLTLIEGVRRSSIRLETECFMDIAMNSVMAEYHRELLNQYNLFYIDSSYGSDYPSYYNTEARLQYYLEKNMNPKEATYIDFLYKDLLALELENVLLTEVALATDFQGKLFQKKAAAAVWSDSGMQLMENVLDWTGTIEDEGLLERDLEAEKQALDAQLEAYNGTERELANHKWIKIEVKNPTEHINTMRAKGVLHWVLEDGAVLSGQKADLSQYLSARIKRGWLNQGNTQQNVEVSTLETVLFHEYMLRYSGHYGEPKEGSLLQYQAEYLIVGKNNDVDNLKEVAGTISGLREVANVTYLNSSPVKMAAIEAVSQLLAAAVTCPELAPVFRGTIVLGWAYLESLYDTKVLLAGGRVPLKKTDSDWHYDLDSIFTSVNMEIHNPRKRGMDYEDYLRVLMYLENQEKITYRFMDLIEMDIRCTEGNEAFRMDGCIERIRAEAEVKSGYGYECTIDRTKEYD